MDNIPPAIKNPELKYTKLFINNEWVDSKDGSTFETINPATEQKIGEVAEAKSGDVDAAVAAARAAFDYGSPWRKMDASKRGLMLSKVADLIERDACYLASLESFDTGRLYTSILFGDIDMAVRVLRYYVGWADKNHGKTIPFDGNYFCYTKHEPIGVCGAIVPWNFPLLLLMMKVAPCLAMGNTIVIKPAEQTPLSALYLASLFQEVGFPPGVVNVVPGFGLVAGHALAHHMDVDKIGFTGSGTVGRLIQKASADSNLKSVTLELGGKSPNIVFADVDIDQAVEISQFAIYTASGQVCVSGSRTYVHEDIYDEFVRKSVERAKTIKSGDPSEITTAHGPLASKAQEERVLGYIDSGIKGGAKVLCGGKKVEGRIGYYIEPTVLTNLRHDMKITQEEIFGPIQQIYKFSDTDEVIKIANDTKYGLAAGVLTNDINKVMKITDRIKSGIVWVNCWHWMSPGSPFGGYKTSGIGRDLGEYALQHYTEVKTVIMKVPA